MKFLALLAIAISVLTTVPNNLIADEKQHQLVTDSAQEDHKVLTPEQLAEIRKKRTDAMREKLKTVKGVETWEFPDCNEMTGGGPSSDFGNGANRLKVQFEKREGDSLKMTVAGEADPIVIGQPLKVQGLFSREVYPQKFESDTVTTGGSDRNWVAVKWYGDKRSWNGKATSYFHYMDSIQNDFQYTNDAGHQTVSTFLWTAGKSFALHFRDKVTVGAMYRMDNQGNAVAFRVEVNDKGERVFSVRATCGNGFGYKTTKGYKKASEADSTSRALMEKVVYTESPQFK